MFMNWYYSSRSDTIKFSIIHCIWQDEFFYSCVCIFYILLLFICQAVILYIASFVGDLFDGMAARKFNQSSSFGGLLDMITDRCATLGLLFVLMGEYGAPGFSEYTKTYKLVSEVPSNNCCFDNTKFLCIRFIIFFFSSISFFSWWIVTMVMILGRFHQKHLFLWNNNNTLYIIILLRPKTLDKSLLWHEPCSYSYF